MAMSRCPQKQWSEARNEQRDCLVARAVHGHGPRLLTLAYSWGLGLSRKPGEKDSRPTNTKESRGQVYRWSLFKIGWVLNIGNDGKVEHSEFVNVFLFRVFSYHNLIVDSRNSTTGC